MLELIRDLATNKKVNVIVSSHLLPDVEYTCDHVVVMDKGRVATEGPISALKEARGQVYELRVKMPTPAFFARLRADGFEWHETEDEVLRVFVPGDAGAQRIFRLAAAEGVQVRHFRPSVSTLEDVFAHAMGED